MTVTWRGKQVSRNVAKATIKGVNKTMSEAVQHAKNNHDWQNRTGTLEGSIAINEPAAEQFNGEVRGVWGSQDVRYALVHELGSDKRNIPARPYLRPAADAQYPQLAEHIRAFLFQAQPRSRR